MRVILLKGGLEICKSVCCVFSILKSDINIGSLFHIERSMFDKSRRFHKNRMLHIESMFKSCSIYQ